MLTIVLSRRKILEEYLKKIGFSNVLTTIPNLSNISDLNNTTIITDSLKLIPTIKKQLTPRKKYVIIFISGISHQKKVIKSSYETNLIKNMISDIIIEKTTPTKVTPIQSKQDILTEEHIIQENIKNTPEISIDRIISFVNKLQISRRIKDNIIIASSEIIDNIIEPNLLLSELTSKIKIRFTLDKDILGITISDYIGIADIYSISKSLENSFTTQRLVLPGLEYTSSRGRGYTIIRKTSDFVTTKILGPESYKKFNEENPFTETTIVYLLNRKVRKKISLSMVVEFI